MSNTATPTKGGKAGGPATADSIMPLLFATIGNPSISFPKMAAMDPEGRTASALEHKFRTWRQKGREIAQANPDHAGNQTPTAKGKKRAPAKKAVGRVSNKETDGDDEEEQEDKGEAANGVKNEFNDDEVDIKSLTPTAKDNKRRAASKGVETDSKEDDNETSVKKAKTLKKSTASIVKKRAPKAHESLEEVTDEEDEPETPEVEKPKPVRRSPVKLKAKIPAAIEEDAQVEMQFELEEAI